jgi:hypothetical protein
MTSNQKRESRLRQRESEQWNDDELPIVGELRECRQLSDDHWQGIDVDGTILATSPCGRYPVAAGISHPPAPAAATNTLRTN